MGKRWGNCENCGIDLNTRSKQVRLFEAVFGVCTKRCGYRIQEDLEVPTMATGFRPITDYHGMFR